MATSINQEDQPKAADDPVGKALDGSVSGSIRVRISPVDIRYMESIASGSKAMELFGDVETEIALRVFGNEGLCAGYERVSFLAPIASGDFVEARGVVTGRGRTSLKIDVELTKHLSIAPDGRAIVHDPPMPLAQARAVVVSADRPAAGETEPDRPASPARQATTTS